MQANDTTTPDGPLILVWYRNAMRLFAGTSMLAIVVIMIVQVFARYVLNASLIWAEELCRYVLIWQSFLLIGIAYHPIPDPSNRRDPGLLLSLSHGAPWPRLCRALPGTDHPRD